MLTYDQIIFRHLLKETSFWLPGGPLPKPRCGHWDHYGGKGPQWWLLGRQNLTVWEKLERQSLIPWLRPAPSNNPIQKTCSILRQVLCRKKEETTFPSYLPVGWYYRPVPQVLFGYWCTLSICSQGTCLWPLSCPLPIRHLLPGRNLLLCLPQQLLHPCQRLNVPIYLIRCVLHPCWKMQQGLMMSHPAYSRRG